MTPKKPSSTQALRIFLALLLLCALLGAADCQKSGAFGLSGSALAKLLSGTDPGPVLALEGLSLDDTGAYGPAAYYYLARWLDSFHEDSVPPPNVAARIALLYRRAFDRGEGLVRREGGVGLISCFSLSSLWEELLSFSEEYAEALGPEWRSERPRLDALDALGRADEAAALVARLASAYPKEAAQDGEALAYFAAASGLRLGGSDWPRAFRRILLEAQSSAWTERAAILVKSESRLRAQFSPEELHAIQMRVDVRTKNYGPAYAQAILAPEATMGTTASRAMIVDAGRAFLFGGALKDGGVARFLAQGWTARYYRARFARSLERWTQAALMFKKAAEEAPSRAEADQALWYAVECSYRGALAAAGVLPTEDRNQERRAAAAAARRQALDELSAASLVWLGSESFLDLSYALFRDALAARDWRLVEAMAQRLAPRLRSDIAARIAYTAARAYELGLDSSVAESSPDAARRAAAAAVRFAAIVEDAQAPLHYRALAAWRARIEPSFVRLDSSNPSPAGEGTMPGELQKFGETEGLVAGFAAFGLGDMAVAESRSRKAQLSDAAARRLAALFSFYSRPDCAIRLALDLSSRPGYSPARSDYEILYPRPYLDIIRSIKTEPRLDEGLALGLLRSESFFKVKALSSAGAIGLSQLMPVTAADQARALGLKIYDLNSPKDNLRIGLAHFAALVKRSGSRPLRAMMAYNAGWGRLKKWTAESGALPDDLMVEAVGIEETKQYCRNILQSAVMYGVLYYDRSVGRTVAELVEGPKTKD